MRLIPLSYNHQAISAPIDTVWQKMKNICNFILFKLNRFPAAEKKKTNFHPHWSNQHLLEFLFISFFSPHLFLPHNIRTVFRNEQTQCSIEQ